METAHFVLAFIASVGIPLSLGLIAYGMLKKQVVDNTDLIKEAKSSREEIFERIRMECVRMDKALSDHKEASKPHQECAAHAVNLGRVVEDIKEIKLAIVGLNENLIRIFSSGRYEEFSKRTKP